MFFLVGCLFADLDLGINVICKLTKSVVIDHPKHWNDSNCSLKYELFTRLFIIFCTMYTGRFVWNIAYNFSNGYDIKFSFGIRIFYFITWTQFRESHVTEIIDVKFFRIYPFWGHQWNPFWNYVCDALRPGPNAWTDFNQI